MNSYGTTHHHDSRQFNQSINHGSREEDTLLSRKDEKLSLSARTYRHLNVDISNEHGDLILLLCYVITGLLDSSATVAWGSFVSMQTGNTVYFGLGLSNPAASSRWIKSGTSIALFSLGSFFFARFHRYFGSRKRWVMLASFSVQLSLVLGAAIVTMLSPRDHVQSTDLHWHVLLSLGMVAFQSSGQAVTSRVLKHGSLTSVVLTSIYCDLFSDANLFAAPSENAERNRRAAAPIMLLIGTVFGGLWASSQIGIVGALCTAAFLKVAIIFAWLLWQNDPDGDVGA